MTYPTQEEILRCDPLLEWIDEKFLRMDPFAFEGKGFRSFVSLLTAELGVDPNGVYCVGSGAVGLSLNPKKMNGKDLKIFDEESDLDIAVISEVHFETAWRDLREAAQATLIEIDGELAENLNWQKKRFFDGAIIANKLLPYLSFGGDWLSASVRISETVARVFDREVDVNIWVYRDYWSLRNYVASGIVKCRKYMV